MTEKRFTTKNIICSNYCIWDNDDKPYGNDDVCVLLNEQDKEIQEGEECYKKLLEKYDELKKENEALRNEVKYLKSRFLVTGEKCPYYQGD